MAGAGLCIVNCVRQDIHQNFQLRSPDYFTLDLLLDARDLSVAPVSLAHVVLEASAFTRILIPLSLVEIANNVPSLLNRMQGEACT